VTRGKIYLLVTLTLIAILSAYIPTPTRTHSLAYSYIPLVNAQVEETGVRLVAWTELGQTIDFDKIKQVVKELGGGVVKENAEYIEVHVSVKCLEKWKVVREIGYVNWPTVVVYLRFYKDGRVVSWLSRGKPEEWTTIFYWESEYVGPTTVLVAAIEKIVENAYPSLRPRLPEILSQVKYYSPEFPDADYIVIAYGIDVEDGESTFHLSADAEIYLIAVLLATFDRGMLSVDDNEILKTDTSWDYELLDPKFYWPGTHKLYVSESGIAPKTSCVVVFVVGEGG